MQILEEIISENKHQPVKANPDEFMNIEKPSPKYTRQSEKNINCIKMDDGGTGEEQSSTDEVWRNFVTVGKRINEETTLQETEQVFF